MAQIAPALFDLATDLAGQGGVNGIEVRVNGAASVNDGGQASYVWVASSTATHDGTSVIKVTNITTGRWIKKATPAPSNIPIGNLLQGDLATATPRPNGTTSSATITVNADTTDNYNVTALATNATIAAPTGTPVQSQELVIRITSDATIRTLTWNAIFRAGSELPLPTATISSKTHYLAFIYNADAVKWDFVGSTII